MANKIYLYRNIHYMESSYNVYDINGHKVYFEHSSQIFDSDVGYYCPTSGPYNIPADDYSSRTFSIPYITENGYASTMEATYNGEQLTWNYSGQSGSFSIYYLENDEPINPDTPSGDPVYIAGIQDMWVNGYGSYNYHNGFSFSEFVVGRTYYISVNGSITGSYVWTSTDASEKSTLTLGGVYIETGDNYISFDSSSEYYYSGGQVSFFYYDTNEPEPDVPSISVTASITLNSQTGIATWSYSASSSEIHFNEPYVQLWDLNDQIMDPVQIADSSYDFSDHMASGQTYYATLRVGYYDYNNGTSDEVTARSQEVIYSPSSPDPEGPTEEKTSFNARMLAIANAIRSKASVSGTMGIVEMITTLNGLSTYGSPNYDSYVNTDFNSCMIKLSKVIRSQNGTIGSVSSLTMAQMPTAIALIELYNSGCEEDCGESEYNPLTLTLTVRDNEGIEVNSNVYMYSEHYGTITWYGVNSGYLYQEGMYNGFDGAQYYINQSYVSSEGEYVYASVTVSAEGYSRTETSESFYIIGSGGCNGGDEQCSQCSESTDCCEDNDECTCMSFCQSCESACEDECESECQACEFGCQD